MEDNSVEDELNFSKQTKEERKPFIHPLLLVLIFLLLIVTLSVFGLYKSLKETTRPKSNINGIAAPTPTGSR